MAFIHLSHFEDLINFGRAVSGHITNSWLWHVKMKYHKIWVSMQKTKTYYFKYNLGNTWNVMFNNVLLEMFYFGIKSKQISLFGTTHSVHKVLFSFTAQLSNILNYLPQICQRFEICLHLCRFTWICPPFRTILLGAVNMPVDLLFLYYL